MSFAFPDIDPNTSGAVYDVPVPLSKYLGASYEAGQHDTLLNSLNRISEMSAADMDETSPILDTETANKNWAVGDLKFVKPVRESVARIKNRRKRDEMDRNFLLSQGSSGMRFAGGMAAGILGSVSNPLDLATMFIPFVGEEAVAARMGSMTGKLLARRLVTREVLQQTFPRAPRLTESIINASAGQAVFEAGNLIASAQDQADYGPGNAAFNIFAGAAFGAGIHGAGVLFNKLTRGTREEMARQAINQLLRDERIHVDQFVHIDEAAIHERIKLDVAALRRTVPVDLEMVKRDMFKESGIKINPATPAAFITPTGESLVGEAHWTEPMIKFLDDHPDAIRAYHTVDGHIVVESVVAEQLGIPVEDLTSEYVTFDKNQNYFTAGEDSHMFQLMEDGASREDAVSTIVGLRNKRAQERFFQNPENQKKAEVEHERQIEQYIATERKNLFEAEKQREIDRQIAEGKILKPEEIQRHTPPAEHLDVDDGAIDEDIATLKKDLKLDEKTPEEGKNAIEEMISKVDDLIKNLSKPGTKMFTGVTGLEPLIAMVGKEVTKGLLIAVREGLKLTNDLTKAIDHAMEWFKKDQKKISTQVVMEKEVPQAKQELREKIQELKEDLSKYKELEAKLKSAKPMERFALAKETKEIEQIKNKHGGKIDEDKIQEQIDKLVKLLNPQQSRRGFLGTLGKFMAGVTVAPHITLPKTETVFSLPHISQSDIISMARLFEYETGYFSKGGPFSAFTDFMGRKDFPDFLRAGKLWKQAYDSLDNKTLAAAISEDLRMRGSSVSVLFTGTVYDQYVLAKRVKGDKRWRLDDESAWVPYTAKDPKKINPNHPIFEGAKIGKHELYGESLHNMQATGLDINITEHDLDLLQKNDPEFYKQLRTQAADIRTQKDQYNPINAEYEHDYDGRAREIVAYGPTPIELPKDVARYNELLQKYPNDYRWTIGKRERRTKAEEAELTTLEAAREAFDAERATVYRRWSTTGSSYEAPLKTLAETHGLPIEEQKKIYATLEEVSKQVPEMRNVLSGKLTHDDIAEMQKLQSALMNARWKVRDAVDAKNKVHIEQAIRERDRIELEFNKLLDRHGDPKARRERVAQKKEKNLDNDVRRQLESVLTEKGKELTQQAEVDEAPHIPDTFQDKHEALMNKHAEYEPKIETINYAVECILAKMA